LAGLTCHFDRRIVKMSDLLRDGKTEPVAAGPPVTRRVHAVEPVENVGQGSAWNAATAVRHLKLQL
jgi:hypothetical protein